VDGGVDLETVADIVKAGAELLVAGSAVFSHGDIRGNARNQHSGWTLFGCGLKSSETTDTQSLSLTG